MGKLSEATAGYSGAEVTIKKSFGCVIYNFSLSLGCMIEELPVCLNHLIHVEEYI